ncbi:MAG: TnpV protein [Anaerostipes sp.]
MQKNPQAWQGFLSSACRNYKCRFDEQLLIYAQRPDAVAVAKLETWNRQFKRWVNKDSKGIAVFDPKGRRNTLKYYFDVSDTHEGYYGSRPVPIWQMDERYEQAVMERLSDRFGDVESTDLASDLMETAKNAVEDNLQDYFSQLKDCTKDSFLEELDDFNIEVIYRRLATNSVAFMLISRCGLDTNEFFDREDFADIVNFNTPATINAIGVATSDIAEMALREISQSIRNVQIAEKDQNRTFAQKRRLSMIKADNNPKGANTMSEITYSRQGDYLIPDLTLPTEPELPLGRYALMHRDYLEKHKRVTYLNLLTSGRLNGHLHEVEQTALQRLELLTKQLSAEQGVTEELKEKAPMQWVGLMNNIRSQAEEVILTELIYK